MAGWNSYNLANEILNLYYRGVSPTIPATLYLRLLVEPSSRSGGGTETNYSGYARVAFSRSTSGLWATAPNNGQLSNAAIITFPQAGSVGNGDLVWFDFVDTASGAVTKIYNGGPINPQKAIVVGKVPKFAIGALVITM